MKCERCDGAATVHLTEINHGVKSDRHLCVEHALAEFREQLAGMGANTPAEVRERMRKTIEMFEGMGGG